LRNLLRSAKVCGFHAQEYTSTEVNATPGKTPTERAKLLETTPLFANIHADAAAAGQTSVPENLDTDLHFTCFVQAPEPGPRQTATSTKTMRLIELDGRRAGPVDRGVCTDLLRVRHVNRHFQDRCDRRFFRMLLRS
jgi:Ubiquitin carboxyl-terminal hydrolase, family 1